MLASFYMDFVTVANNSKSPISKQLYYGVSFIWYTIKLNTGQVDGTKPSLMQPLWNAAPCQVCPFILYINSGEGVIIQSAQEIDVHLFERVNPLPSQIN